MNQRWYRSGIVKAVQIILAHIMAVIITISFLWLMAYPALRTEIFEGNPAEEYKDTADFGDRVLSLSSQVMRGTAAKMLFEENGTYDPERLVDIEEYYNTGTFTGENKGRLIYKLGDLAEWGNNLTDLSSEPEDIIVCKTEEEYFRYYPLSEFYKMIDSGEFHFAAANGESGYTDKGILKGLESGYGMDQGMYRGIQDREGQIVYSDCWLYDGLKRQELYKPKGAGSLIEIANEEPRWNGSLNEAYSILESVLYGLNQRFYDYGILDSNVEQGDTNFSYIYADTKNKRIYTNEKKYMEYAGLEESLETLRKSGRYVIIEPRLADFESNMDISADIWWNRIRYDALSSEDFIFAVAVDTKYPIQDEFYTENKLYEKYGSNAKYYIFWGLTAAVIFLINVLWLVVTAGRSSTDDELHLNWFDYWKTELSAAVIILGWLLSAFIMLFAVGFGGVDYVVKETEILSISRRTYISSSVPYIICYSLFAIFTCSMFLTGLLSLVRRLKARIAWKNSLLRGMCKFIVMIYKNISSVWKIIILFGCFVLSQLLFILMTYRDLNRMLVCMMFVADVLVFSYLIYSAVGKGKIKTGVERIASGEVDYAIPTKYLRGEYKEIAEKINSIGEGLEAALEESIKSERLKTDLITNVSHDIKTPLTSIINYVELLKQEDFQDPKLKRYIEVLEQKSQRLKTLTEDVVEASKVSSGNITLEYMNLNFVEMIQQTSGEFEEKFAVRGLKEILTLPDEGVLIRADGRRTWRVLENVYNNAAKYAMEGTRIYGDLTVDELQVSFSLKNISEQPLNISADELTERFIRGDISRSTEGSGLGLSIAKTLTQMQGGKFEPYLDGDLFKVTITFPRVR
ncbi:HAMP domain-containing sensor histidine kinase [Lachnospiraceae bacterium 42-17]